ncbi:ABC transporter substrate-binding protein [Chelatococcus reniformis]|uniref:Branched-chain amino acid ABC transporter substrate-binding protein n=1 Tax=Chelatococcus reniformis TaxID=1494448 RepID=A0A916UPH6_9HYPH|nr:ABC transporter substrate-binding protein [Chelatococcus reniformis]GGC80445.1 branched-chain amino acid ABC transporter substrate-binding protein [Chelatococcus reniformis]
MTYSPSLPAIGAVLVGLAAGFVVAPALAQKQYGPGVSDTEIKIGNTMAYSGPVSPYGVIGKTAAAYFRMTNEKGGINGRKINFISYDDAYSPPKTVEQTRKLVESDGVLLIFNGLGTPPQTAVQKYLNSRGVPQLFVATGASKWGNPREFPWTMGFGPTYEGEGRIYARYVLDKHPVGKIAILYQNDDYGRDYLNGFKDGLGDKAKSQIVAEATYEGTDTTVDSQILRLQASGADVFFNVTTAKFSAQAIKKMAEIGWKPVHLLNSVSNSVGAVMTPAGPANAKGVLSAAYGKDPTDPQWRDDPAYKEWLAFMNTYYPEGDKTSTFTVYGFIAAQTMVQVLKQAGDNLTRENVMRQAAGLKDLDLGMLLPGIAINTSATDYFPIEQMQLQRFNGDKWDLFGPIISGEGRS